MKPRSKAAYDDITAEDSVAPVLSVGCPHAAAMREHAQFAATELGCLRVIVTTGITTLQENLHLLTERQEAAARQGDPMDPAVATALERALQAVQFDDMAVQLIDRVNARLMQLDRVLLADSPMPPAVMPLHSAANRDRAVTFGEDAPGGDIELF
jgi:hypothetical protein